MKLAVLDKKRNKFS